METPLLCSTSSSADSKASFVPTIPLNTYVITSVRQQDTIHAVRQGGGLNSHQTTYLSRPCEVVLDPLLIPGGGGTGVKVTKVVQLVP